MSPNPQPHTSPSPTGSHRPLSSTGLAGPGGVSGLRDLCLPRQGLGFQPTPFLWKSSSPLQGIGDQFRLEGILGLFGFSHSRSQRRRGAGFRGVGSVGSTSSGQAGLPPACSCMAQMNPSIKSDQLSSPWGCNCEPALTQVSHLERGRDFSQLKGVLALECRHLSISSKPTISLLITELDLPPKICGACCKLYADTKTMMQSKL